jgi:HNH endonuclease
MKLHPHPTIEGLFLTKDGKVFKQLPVTKGYGGYGYVHVGGRFAVRRHILMLETFHGPRPESAVARHLNGYPWDDSKGNLAWGTQEQNCGDTVRYGKSTRGGRNAQAKLESYEVLAIRKRLKSGESGSVLAREFGISRPTICDIAAGRTWGWLKPTGKNAVLEVA